MSTDVDKLAETAAVVFMHHDRAAGDSVRPGLPDVFVTGDDKNGYDIAVRIDGGYSGREWAEAIADYWLQDVRKLAALARSLDIDLS